MPPRKPQVGRPPSVSRVSLSSRLPPLRLPRSSAPLAPTRPHPQVARPQKPTSAAPPPRGALPGRSVVDAVGCSRCRHAEGDHPVRYACDKYPHPDPLQLCGCETETLVEVCPSCSHKARSHKPRHRCRVEGCGCWAYQEG